MPDEITMPDFDDEGYDAWLDEQLKSDRENEQHEQSAIRRGELITQEQLN